MKVVFSIRVEQVVKAKLDRLKEYNPDTSWETILEPIITQVRLPKPQSKSTVPPPIIPTEVQYNIQ